MQGTGSNIRHDQRYEHVPTSHESEVVLTILCDQQVPADRTIPNNKSDFIIRDNEKKESFKRHCNFRRYKCDQERSRKVFKI